MNYKEKKDKLEKLVGSKIKGIYLNIKNDYLKIVTDKGDYNFVVMGDCCSKSWITHMNGADKVTEGIVIEEIETRPDSYKRYVAEEDKEYDRNVIQDYITTIKTDKGSLDIEFRNNSNGYYSGWLELDGDKYGNPINTPKLTKLERDF